ncbi:MAG: 3-oxoacyl-ACP reductase, partial [Spirochaetae bacterium HGW-Spirochaetae-7]
MKEQLLEGKSCVVTGGSKGIGLAIVRAFIAEGASVEYYSRSKADGHDELAATASAGRELRWTACDVSDAAALEAAIEASAARGPLDVVVNNAGITRDGLVFRMSVDDWRAVVDTNLTSAFIVCRSAARTMIKRRSGSIINVSSVVGITGNGGQTNYSASKAGLIGFTKSLAKEVASRGVRVNAVAPGF